MRNDMKVARGRRSLLVRLSIGILLISWLAMAATLNRASATTASPQFSGCRSMTSLNVVPDILARIDFKKGVNSATAAVKLILNPNHRMFCVTEISCAPGVFTLDTVKYRLSLSTNIAGLNRVNSSPDQPGCPLEADYFPAEPSSGSILYVKLYFQENYNINGGIPNPKKISFTLTLPALNDIPADQNISLVDGGYQITVVEDTDPDGL